MLFPTGSYCLSYSKLVGPPTRSLQREWSMLSIPKIEKRKFSITKKLIEDVINLIKYNALDLWEFSSVFYKSALEGG